jgi:hypothetical protein
MHLVKSQAVVSYEGCFVLFCFCPGMKTRTGKDELLANLDCNSWLHYYVIIWMVCLNDLKFCFDCSDIFLFFFPASALDT